jgi:catechol 1,2-dioxygenase
MRPAHLHFIVIAPGHKVLTTQIFDALDPHAHNDAAFGAVGSLLRNFESDGQDGFRLDIEFKLEPGETVIPRPPLV